MKRSAILCIIIAIFILISIILIFPYLPGTDSQSRVSVKILAVNDFHGHLFAGQQLNDRPVGSAPVLASYLKSAMNFSDADYTLIALTGDTIGASPAESALLQDEPTIEFFNSLANDEYDPLDSGKWTGCNIISIPGNHEFNDGTNELMRIVYGGNGTTSILRTADPYPGTMADYICANVVWKENGTPVFSPYTIREINGVQVAFIGAVTLETTIL